MYREQICNLGPGQVTFLKIMKKNGSTRRCLQSAIPPSLRYECDPNSPKFTWEIDGISKVPRFETYPTAGFEDDMGTSATATNIQVKFRCTGDVEKIQEMFDRCNSVHYTWKLRWQQLENPHVQYDIYYLYIFK